MDGRKIKPLIVAAFTFAATQSQASTVFDFESSSATVSPWSSTRLGGFGTLTFEEGGLGMTITRPTLQSGPSYFDVIDNSLAPEFFPSGWGSRSLDSFYAGRAQPGTDNAPFQLDFSSAINSFSVEFGDFGQDSGDVLAIYAYSIVGGAINGSAANYLGSSSFSVSGRSSLPTFSVGSFAASGIRSIVMIGGTPVARHSVFYDNITVNMASAVPEPEAYLMFGIGIAVAAIRSRKRLTK
jgi:hypothetical protein